jgi:signal transduction histidine kinase
MTTRHEPHPPRVLLRFPSLLLPSRGRTTTTTTERPQMVTTEGTTGESVKPAATTMLMREEEEAKTAETTENLRKEAFRWPSLLRRSARRLTWIPTSLRTRIAAWFIGFFALAMGASILVTYEALLIRLDQRIDEDLRQEVAELRNLVDESDPASRSDVGRIFTVYLQRNVPSENEALITFVNGEPHRRSRPIVPYRLDQDPALVERWATLREPDRGRVNTPAGRVEYLAVPVGPERSTHGVFVAAIFRDREKSEVNAAVTAVGAFGFAVLLVASLIAWRLADRVIKPVRELTTTARSISETDLSARIPERGRDEVAQLAATFNSMLGRLERAFESQRRFLDDAGHELKTPLTIVRGHLELLGDDPKERRETMPLVLDELDRMTRIIGDVLLLAKHERSDFLELSTVDVGTLTDELHAKAKALAPRDWVIEKRGRGVIIADRQRLTQAMMQLALNAARYSETGEAIRLGSNVSNGEARFWISDQGPGIPFEEQRMIFERFQRGSDTRRWEGAGLGLAIVKAIAEAHHGRVELKSRPGSGATFTLVVAVDQPGAGRTAL